MTTWVLSCGYRRRTTPSLRCCSSRPACRAHRHGRSACLLFAMCQAVNVIIDKQGMLDRNIQADAVAWSCRCPLTHRPTVLQAECFYDLGVPDSDEEIELGGYASDMSGASSLGGSAASGASSGGGGERVAACREKTQLHPSLIPAHQGCVPLTWYRPTAGCMLELPVPTVEWVQRVHAAIGLHAGADADADAAADVASSPAPGGGLHERPAKAAREEPRAAQTPAVPAAAAPSQLMALEDELLAQIGAAGSELSR